MPADRASYYLTPEASVRRIDKLIDRIARDGLRPGESVPHEIAIAADIRRGEIRTSS